MINLKIRINVDEQVLALPIDTQFVPSIPEKDPVVMVGGRGLKFCNMKRGTDITLSFPA